MRRSHYARKIQLLSVVIPSDFDTIIPLVGESNRRP